MTIDEAIYCMRSYLPKQHETCRECKYYGCKHEKDNIHTCCSDDAHMLAIEALTKMRDVE